MVAQVVASWTMVPKDLGLNIHCVLGVCFIVEGFLPVHLPSSLCFTLFTILSSTATQSVSVFEVERSSVALQLIQEGRKDKKRLWKDRQGKRFELTTAGYEVNKMRHKGLEKEGTTTCP